MLQPLPPQQNTVIEYIDETSGPNLPKTYIPSIKKGFEFMCEKGLYDLFVWILFYKIRFKLRVALGPG